MKRLFAALAAIGLLFSCALAQEEAPPIASYVMPDGAQVFYLPAGEAPESVEGLEGMYELMMNTSMMGDVYLLQMEGGHAMASVSCMPVGRDFTAQELQALWPQIAQDISFEALGVNSAAECAAVETLHDQEMLHIQTEITVGAEENPLLLKAEALAFCQDRAVTEIWLVHPDEAAFAGDAAVLEKDLQSLQAFEDSLFFPGENVMFLGGLPYEDRLGRFSMIVPADGVVIDSATAEEAIEETRALFIQANPAGADAVFEKLLGYVRDLDSVLVFSGDMQGVIEVSATEAQELDGMKPEELVLMAQSIQQNMAEEYDVAAFMGTDQNMWLSDQEHAFMGYWLRMGEMDLLLDLMVCVHGGWLYEVDVYAAEANQDVRTTLHAYTSQSIVYTPPVNGLE